MRCGRLLPERGTATAVVAALLLAGCVKPGDPEVGINPLTADVVFGAPTKEAAPAIIPDTGPAQAPAQAFDGAGLFPQPVEAKDLPKATRNPSTPSRSSSSVSDSCRPATVNDFAPEVSPPRPGERRPTPGVYRWKRAGTRTYTVPGAEGLGPQTEQIRGFEERIVQNVTPYGGQATDFEYETVQKDLDNNTVTIKWRVRQTAENRNVNSNFPPFRQNVGEADRGLSLVSISVTSPTGENQPGFAPRTPLLYLPIETTISDAWTSVAVDPRTLQSVELEGAVARHAEVDACGEVVDGWLVEGTLTQTTGEGEVKSKFDYVVANQFGSLVIATHQETPKDEPVSKLDFSLARITPKPLPAR